MNFDKVRPKHDDFWKLSQIIVSADDQSDRDPDYLYKVIAQSVDSYSVTYMATQRAFRALGIVTQKELVGKQDEAAKMAALWLEGFLVGIEFGKEEK